MIGDHIRALRNGRWAHAIDCGDETVIQLAADPPQPPRVRRSYRPEFVATAEAVEVVRHRERTFPAEQVVARAYSRISDPALASMFHDSEAFAEWCATGRFPTAPPNVAVAVVVPGAKPAAKAVKSAKPARKAPAGRRRRAKPAKPGGRGKRSGAAKAKPKKRR